MKAHSSLAGRHGITEDEIEKLITLNKSDFKYREWCALKYAQDCAFLEGQEPAGDYMDDFHASYSERERKYILKLIRVMLFANFWNNTFHGRAWRESTNGTCDVKQDC